MILGQGCTLEILPGLIFNMSIETITTEQKILYLAKSTGDAKLRLADQLMAKVGTGRRSEILTKIGDTGEPYEKRLNDYLLSL